MSMIPGICLIVNMTKRGIESLHISKHMWCQLVIAVIQCDRLLTVFRWWMPVVSSADMSMAVVCTFLLRQGC